VTPRRERIRPRWNEGIASFPGHHMGVTFRAARRRRPGPQARVAGRSAAKSLDEAEHRSTLADVMAESTHVIIGERARDLHRDPRGIAATHTRHKEVRKRPAGTLQRVSATAASRRSHANDRHRNRVVSWSPDGV